MAIALLSAPYPHPFQLQPHPERLLNVCSPAGEPVLLQVRITWEAPIVDRTQNHLENADGGLLLQVLWLECYKLAGY